MHSAEHSLKLMETLAEFFTKLSKYEGTPAAKLAWPWRQTDVSSITKAFDAARKRSPIQFSVRGSTSVQALGNRVADAVADGLRPHLGRYRLCRCTGQGYPDRRLERPDANRSFAFELKAKTGLDPRDTQRMILTSGTRKLRRNFRVDRPICHLLTTAVYSVARRGRRSVIRVHGLDFEFLEPSTLVQNQYEASVNQRLLAKGKHSRRLLLWGPRAKRRHPGVAARRKPKD